MRKTHVVVVAVAAALVGLLVFAHDGEGQGVRRRGRDGARLAAPPLAAQPLPAAVLPPADNPASTAKATLGRLLFWDPILSGHRDVACATCHHPRFAYAENRDISIGVHGRGLGDRRRFAAGSSMPFVRRNSPTILNTAFNGIDDEGRYASATAPMFWDSRADSLEAQALLPIQTFEEMRGDAYPESAATATVVSRLNANAEYVRLFREAFGRAPIVPDQLARALAAFERTLTTTDAPFDRYMRGDRDAMTAAQVAGMRRFERIGCTNCHRGPMFSDYKLHVLGVPDNSRLTASDSGVDGTYAFRTPSLRNVSLTGPYMHSGVFDSLDDVLEFYDDVSGRRRSARNPNVSREQLDPLVRQLRDPDRDADALIAFLEALADNSFDTTIPARVPSGLAVGGRIQ